MLNIIKKKKLYKIKEVSNFFLFRLSKYLNKLYIYYKVNKKIQNYIKYIHIK